MAQLKIECEHSYCEYGATLTEKLESTSVKIRIFDGQELMAETSLESLIQKFLVVSSEYAKAMALLGLLQEKQKGKVLVAGKNEVSKVVQQQMEDFRRKQDS